MLSGQSRHRHCGNSGRIGKWLVVQKCQVIQIAGCFRSNNLLSVLTPEVIRNLTSKRQFTELFFVESYGKRLYAIRPQSGHHGDDRAAVEFSTKKSADRDISDQMRGNAFLQSLVNLFFPLVFRFSTFISE